MQRDRLVPMVGLVASVAVLVTFVAPYLVAAAPAVTVYYLRGLTSGFSVALLTGVALWLFAREAFGAGSAPLVVGVLAGVGSFVAILAATWAMFVPSGVVMGLSRTAELTYHRWVLLGCAGVVALVALVHATSAYSNMAGGDDGR